MLRINLLPPYIYEGAKRRNVTILWVVILLAVIGGFFYVKMQKSRELDDINRQTADATPAMNEAQAAKAEADRINQESATIRGKADFVRTARDYNAQIYPQLFSNVALYTMPRVLYDSASPAQQTVVLNAFAPSLADVGHYMIAMERNPNIDNVNVALSSIPGFPFNGTSQGGSQPTGERPGPGGHNFVATLTLTKPIPGGPAYPAGSTGATPATGSGGGTGGMGGGMMGPGGPMSGGMMGPGGPMSGGPMSGGPMGGPMGGGPKAIGAAGTVGVGGSGGGAGAAR